MLSSVASFLVYNFNNFLNKILELSLRNLSITVDIKFFENVINILLWRLFYVEGISEPPEDHSELMSLNESRSISVKSSKGCSKLFFSNSKCLWFFFFGHFLFYIWKLYETEIENVNLWKNQLILILNYNIF